MASRRTRTRLAPQGRSLAKRRNALGAVIVLLALLAGVVLFVRDRGKRAKAQDTDETQSDWAPAPGGPRDPLHAQGNGPNGGGGSGNSTWAMSDATAPPIPPIGSNMPFRPPAFPPGSQPLTEGTDPMMHPKDEVPVSPGDGITCVFGPRSGVVHPPDPIVFDLEVKNRLGALLPIRDGVVRFRPDRTDPEKAKWFEAPFVDTGAGRDITADDRKYTSTFFPNDEQRAAFAKGGSHVYVEVYFDAPEALGSRKFPTVIEYSRLPHATLNGKWSDEMSNGSLVVHAGVNATQAGDYRVIASLYAADTDTAIAFASKPMPLEVGDGDVPLLFFGKILFDRGIDGPYELRYVMLSEEIVGQDTIPGETVDHAYTTQRYHASNFSSAAYVPPAPTFEAVNRFHPSQQGKPGPLLGDDMENPPDPLPSATSAAAPPISNSAK
jgi:hypothetical protein